MARDKEKEAHRSAASNVTHSQGWGAWMQAVGDKFGVDWCDRLNIIHTPSLLIMCSCLSVYAEQVGNKHIQCW